MHVRLLTREYGVYYMLERAVIETRRRAIEARLRFELESNNDLSSWPPRGKRFRVSYGWGGGTKLAEPPPCS